MKLLLFDIDGTLLLSGGAGLRGMNRAFEKLYNIPNILDGITLSGRTDNKIMEDAFYKAGLEFSSDELEKFKTVYFQVIEEEGHTNVNNKRTMPGVDDLLPRLAARNDVYLGLLTGNWEKSGRTKLGFFDLNKYFVFGAFSDDSSNRNELAPIAMNRFKQIFDIEPHLDEVYVIGDTPADMLEGRNAGCRGVVGVLSGPRPVTAWGKYWHTHVIESVKDLPELIKAEFM